MASSAIGVAQRAPWSADAYEKFLSGGAVVLLGFVAAALLRGHSQWGQIALVVWFHLATIGTALALTPVMLLRRRGDARHRLLGRIWVVAMLLTATGSLAIREANHGGWSIIHLLSAWTMIQVPIIWLSARAHNVKRHRRAVRGMVTGALLIAGFFTFPFDRMLGHFLFA